MPKASRTCPQASTAPPTTGLDLDGEGSPGVLSRAGRRAGSTSATSARPIRRATRPASRRPRAFAAAELVDEPSVARSARRRPPAVARSRRRRPARSRADARAAAPGFFERTRRRAGATFRRSARSRSSTGTIPNLRFVDLDRRRPRRCPDHRGRRAALVPLARARRASAPDRRVAQAERRGAGPARRLRRRHRVDLPRRHVGRRSDAISCASATAKSATGRTSATAASAPRSRWTTRRGSTSPTCSTQRRHASCRHRRLRHHRHHLPRARRRAALLQPVRQRLERTPHALRASRRSTICRRLPVARPARQRHRLPGLVVAAAGERAPADALCRPDGRAEAAPARPHRQQPRRGDPHPVCALDQVLPRRPARRHAVGHAAAVSGARGRARRDLRLRQPQPLRHALRLSSRLLRRRRARVPRLRHGRAVGHRGTRGARQATRLPGSVNERRRLARAAGPDQDLVPHRRLFRRGTASRDISRPSITARIRS